MVPLENESLSSLKQISNNNSIIPVKDQYIRAEVEPMALDSPVIDRVAGTGEVELPHTEQSGSFIFNISIFDKLCRFLEIGHDESFYENIRQAAQNAATSIWSILKKAEDESNIDDKELILLLEILMKIASKSTYEHSQRVMRWSVSLAKHLQLDPEQIDDIKMGALFSDIGETGVFYMRIDSEENEKLSDFLKNEITAYKDCGEFHDIGKLEIPKEIVNKTSRLTEKEFEIMKQHPIIGETLLKPIKSLNNILPAVRHHHERWDGKGYPDGLNAEKIPLSARIVALTDSFDAMISDRPYRRAMSGEEAMNELRKNSGTQFDPQLVLIFLKLIEQENTEKLQQQDSSELYSEKKASILEELVRRLSLKFASDSP